MLWAIFIMSLISSIIRKCRVYTPLTLPLSCVVHPTIAPPDMFALPHALALLIPPNMALSSFLEVSTTTIARIYNCPMYWSKEFNNFFAFSSKHPVFLRFTLLYCDQFSLSWYLCVDYLQATFCKKFLVSICIKCIHGGKLIEYLGKIFS